MRTRERWKAISSLDTIWYLVVCRNGNEGCNRGRGGRVVVHKAAAASLGTSVEGTLHFFCHCGGGGGGGGGGRRIIAVSFSNSPASATRMCPTRHSSLSALTETACATQATAIHVGKGNLMLPEGLEGLCVFEETANATTQSFFRFPLFPPITSVI